MTASRKNYREKQFPNPMTFPPPAALPDVIKDRLMSRKNRRPSEYQKVKVKILLFLPERFSTRRRRRLGHCYFRLFLSFLKRWWSGRETLLTFAWFSKEVVFADAILFFRFLLGGLSHQKFFLGADYARLGGNFPNGRNSFSSPFVCARWFYAGNGFNCVVLTQVMMKNVFFGV